MSAQKIMSQTSLRYLDIFCHCLGYENITIKTSLFYVLDSGFKLAVVKTAKNFRERRRRFVKKIPNNYTIK